MELNTFRIPAYQYIHVFDKNTLVTELIVGPKTFIQQDHEQIITGSTPLQMIILPPRHYCQITNPVLRDLEGVVEREPFGQVKVKTGDIEIRFFEDYQEPFPLYPGEKLSLQPTLLQVVPQLQALKIEAIRDFVNEKGEKIKTGQQWLFRGPATYRPKVEEKILCTVHAQVIGPQQALRLRALRDTNDFEGKFKKTGEEWIIRKECEYIPDVNEVVVELQNGYILNDRQSIFLRALQNFKDIYGKDRKAGEQWIVTSEQASFHLLDVYEELVQVVQITILNSSAYCVIQDYFDPKQNKNVLGSKKLVVGEKQFFLMPGESIPHGIKKIHLLEENQALLLKANREIEVSVNHKDEETGKIVVLRKKFQPGDRWMEYGPTKYIPPVEVEIIEQRSLIPLDKNEGIYVRNVQTGHIRSQIGESYMLKAKEQLHELEVGDQVEEFLKKQNNGKERIKYKVITYQCPFNSAIQIYDYKNKSSRVVIGPSLIMLGPDEQFTISVLSGGNPKKPGLIKTLFIMMGPTFSSDTIIVETSDHAALKLQLSYNWQFRVDPNDEQDKQKIFNVKDFIGNLCNHMGSTIRQTVAQVDFDTFHKTSSRLIRKAVFGVDEKQKIRSDFVFQENNLVITNVDIQNVEPVDDRTRQNLQKTVTMSIEITTQGQEAKARQVAQRQEQSAIGEIQNQQIIDQQKAEKEKIKLLELQAISKSVLSLGQSIADTKARIESENIEVSSHVKNAQLRAQAKLIEFQANLKKKVELQKAIQEHQKLMTELEIIKSQQMAEIEAQKFKNMIASVGKETVVQMANAGPEMQAKLLEGLGLQGFIMTDGNNPINLFSAGQNLVDQQQAQKQQ